MDTRQIEFIEILRALAMIRGVIIKQVGDRACHTDSDELASDLMSNSNERIAILASTIGNALSHSDDVNLHNIIMMLETSGKIKDNEIPRLIDWIQQITNKLTNLLKPIPNYPPLKTHDQEVIELSIRVLTETKTRLEQLIKDSKLKQSLLSQYSSVNSKSVVLRDAREDAAASNNRNGANFNPKKLK